MQASTSTEAGKDASHRPDPPARTELAAAFPQLDILDLIGQGGMGFVFKARQPKLDRYVALKILPAGLAADPAFAERFTREGRMLARLSHPNIVAVHDFGQANGFFYLLMEFVDGVNLRQAMKAGRFTPGQALAIVPKICEALQFAHNEGVLHRDIKPENILLDAKGRVKIADFGIAKLLGEPGSDATLTASGAALGTPHYMAPEQLEQPQSVDQRADIYSLGVVFYEMLTGELPIGRFAPPSEKSTVDPRVDEVVLHTLEKERERRTQSAGEVKTQVENITGSAPVAAAATRTTAAAGTVQSRPDHFWRWFAVGSVLLFVLVVALGLLGTLAYLRTAKRIAVTDHAATVVESTNSVLASIAPWSLPDTPSSTDLGDVLQQAKELAAKGSYEEALQRYIWYHNHSKTDPSQAGVRNSFALSDWVELGRRYPRARQALIEIRDKDARDVMSGRGYFELMMELTSINQYLGDTQATVDAFKSLERGDPQLAQRTYDLVQPTLIQRREYILCLKYIGSPEARFESLRHSWETMKTQYERQNLQRQQTNERLQQMNSNSAVTLLPPPYPDLSKIADNSFITQTRQLIQILVATGRQPDAETIRDQAVSLLNDPRLQSAVSDATEAIQRQNPGAANQ